MAERLSQTIEGLKSQASLVITRTGGSLGLTEELILFGNTVYYLGANPNQKIVPNIGLKSKDLVAITKLIQEFSETDFPAFDHTKQPEARQYQVRAGGNSAAFLGEPDPPPLLADLRNWTDKMISQLRAKSIKQTR